jgi:hypothetical protein
VRLYESAALRWDNSKGQCNSCGFFGKHRWSWYEVTLEERDRGFFVTANAEPNVEPGCFRGAADLEKERHDNLQKRADGEPLADDEGNVNFAPELAALRDVLEFDRKCPDWYPYSPGFSPKEHLEELRMMQLEADRRGHDKRLEAQRQEFQTALAGQRQEFDNTMANRDAAENRRSNKLVFAIGLTGILIALIIGGIQIWLSLHAPAPVVVVHVTPPTSATP